MSSERGDRPRGSFLLRGFLLLCAWVLSLLLAGQACDLALRWLGIPGSAFWVHPLVMAILLCNLIALWILRRWLPLPES